MNIRTAAPKNLVHRLLMVTLGLTLLAAGMINAFDHTPSVQQLQQYGILAGTQQNSGTALLALMSTDCVQCRESVTILNEIAGVTDDFISIWAVCADTPQEIDRFIGGEFAFYPVVSIEAEHMSSLMTSDPLPQFLLIRDGHILSRWQGEAPDPSTLMNLSAAGEGA